MATPALRWKALAKSYKKYIRELRKLNGELAAENHRYGEALRKIADPYNARYQTHSAETVARDALVVLGPLVAL